MDPWAWIVANYEGLLVVGGMVGIGLATWRSIVASQLAKASLQQARVIERQAEISNHYRLNEQFKAGVELFGHENAGTRLAGTIILTELMQGYPDDYHMPVIRLFVAFLQYPPCKKPNSNETDFFSPDLVQIVDVINETDDGDRELEMGDHFDLAYALQGTSFRYVDGRVVLVEGAYVPDEPVPEVQILP